MKQDSKGQGLNASYSLRRQVVPSKRFEDFYLERQPLSKRKDLQTREKLTGNSGEGSASTSSQIPIPVLPVDTLSCGDVSSALPQHFPGSSLPAKHGCESTYKVAGAILSTVSEASESVGRRKKQAKPDQAEKALVNRKMPLVINLCSPEQKSMSTSQSHGEPQLGSKIPMDSRPQAPKVKKENHQSNDFKQRQEIAVLILELAQKVPALVSEVGCTINLQQELLRIQKYSEASAVSSLDSGLVRGPEWIAGWDKEDMFFPHLEDSSLMAEAKERKMREMAQESSLWQMAEAVKERYIKNAAVLPDLLPAALSEPVLIHGHTVEDYQAIYHSVVDPMLKTKSGSARRYNLGMGRAIKQRLWEKMSCPTFVETVDADGRVHITESFSTPTLKSFAPQFDVDLSVRPLPRQPQWKKARR